MGEAQHRRRIAAVLAALTVLAAACGPAGSPDDPGFTATELRGGVTLVSGPDGNVVVAEGRGGLVIVDGGSAEHGEALLQFIARQTGERRVATLIDTTWRSDRTGLNEILGARDTTIVAHFNAMQWMKYGAIERADGEVYAPLPEAALPDVLIFDEGGSLPFGDGEIRLGYLLQAHTDADLYVYFEAADVLVTGAAFRSDGWSMIDWGAGAYLGGLDDAGRTLLAVAGDDTIVVPGSGPVMTKADLQSQAEMYAEMFTRMADLVLGAKSPAEAVAAKPTGEFHPEWPDADEFVDRAHRSYRTHIRRDPRLRPIP